MLGAAEGLRGSLVASLAAARAGRLTAGAAHAPAARYSALIPASRMMRP